MVMRKVAAARQQQAGFTMVEIALILVIIGMLVSGIMKGQELITSARVRTIVATQDAVKAAYFSFLDRYRALPGDYSQATLNIGGISTGSGCGVTGANGNGDGDGQILASASSAAENILAWEHLSKARFLNATFTCATSDSPATTPTNPYGAYMDLGYTSGYQVSSGAPRMRHALKTGGSIPSDLLAEIDRKIDDGNPGQGSFRGQFTGNVDTTTSNCFSASEWVVVLPGSNCGGVTLF